MANIICNSFTIHTYYDINVVYNILKHSFTLFYYVTYYLALFVLLSGPKYFYVVCLGLDYLLDFGPSLGLIHPQLRS